MDIYERIRNGEFDIDKSKYPSWEDRQAKASTEMESWLEGRKRRRVDERHMHQVVFRKALAEEHGLVDNHYEEKLWRLAWDYGHASGLQEVANYYAQLAELVYRPATG